MARASAYELWRYRRIHSRGDGSGGKAKKTPMLPHEMGGEEEEEGEEIGGTRGFLRFLGGTRREGKGEYEMVGMAERGEG